MVELEDKSVFLAAIHARVIFEVADKVFDTFEDQLFPASVGRIDVLLPVGGVMLLLVGRATGTA